MVQLRDHPLIQRPGKMPSWPPVWSNVTQGGNFRTPLKGEVGTLTGCGCNRSVPNLCFLFIEHNGESYAGALIVHDTTFGEQLVAILRQHIGQSIEEIGDLDLSQTL